MNYLLDTGFFYALLNDSEEQHSNVLAASALIEPGQIYLPSVVTTEVAYLVLRDLGSKPLAEFAEIVAAGRFTLLEPMPADYGRAAEVIRQYADSHIDFVDAVIVALAERLDVTHILTIDQRHFRLFRPRHCPAFELLP